MNFFFHILPTYKWTG